MTYESLLPGLRTGYDRAADERDGAILEPWKSIERQRLLGKLKGERASTLLEIGSGPGVHAQFFQDEGLSVTCTDLSPELVERCRRRV